MITILGRKFCVVQSLNQIATVYKNSIILTSDDMIKGVYAQLGMSPDGNHKIWNSSEAKTSSLAGQPIVLSHGSLNTQLLPGQNLDDISAKVFEHMEDLLQWKNVSNSTSTQSQTKTVLLHRWCADVLGEAVAKACFGEELLEASPDFLEQMYTLDLYTWQILLKIPTVFVRKVTVAKQHCVEAFARYFRLPAAERPGMCYWVRIVEEQQRQAGMNDYDIGIAAFVFYWA